MNQGIEQYKDCLKDLAFQPSENGAHRISLNSQNQDPDSLLYNTDNPYGLDQEKIATSNAARRLYRKSQAFFDIDNPNIHTRGIHTNEVASIGVICSDWLGLNSQLVRAGAMGHDLGHGPGSHSMETALGELNIPFHHERFGPIIASFIEREGDGLNLSQETLKIMYEHSRGSGELTTKGASFQEALIVMYADKIASITGDISDMQRQGVLSEDDYNIINTLLPGKRRNRINQCISGLIQESYSLKKVSFNESEIAVKFSQIKEIMYKYYNLLTRRSLTESIKSVYSAIDGIHQLENYDISMLIALLSDNELAELDHIHRNKRLNLDDLCQFSIFEVIKAGFLENQTYTSLDQRISALVYPKLVDVTKKDSSL